MIKDFKPATPSNNPFNMNSKFSNLPGFLTLLLSGKSVCVCVCVCVCDQKPHKWLALQICIVYQHSNFCNISNSVTRGIGLYGMPLFPMLNTI